MEPEGQRSSTATIALEAFGQDGARRRIERLRLRRKRALGLRLVKCELHADHSLIAARIAGRDITARIGVPGRHMVQNVLAVLGAAHLVEADLDRSCVGAGRPFG